MLKGNVDLELRSLKCLHGPYSGALHADNSFGNTAHLSLNYIVVYHGIVDVLL